MAINIALLEKIIVFVINCLGIFLAFWVYSANRKERLNQWFAAMTFSVILWVNFALLGYQAKSANLSKIFYRLNWSAVSLFILSAFYFYIKYFLKKKNKILEVIVLLIGSALAITSAATNLIIKNVSIKSWGSEIIFGPANMIFNSFSLIIGLLVVGLLIKEYFKSSKFQKLKIQYFLIGTFLFTVSNIIFNIVIPLLKKSVIYQHFGDYSAIILIGFTAYAIVKKKLFGLRVIITQVLVAIMAILLFVNVWGSEAAFDYIWKGALLIAFLVFGWLLVKSIVKEIKQKEEMDKLAGQLAITNVKLKNAYQKLQKLDKAKSEFISISSHQLRTPLTAIKGYISMLLEGDYGSLPPKAKQPLKNVFESNERLIKLVNSLLDISRIEAGKLKFEPAKFSVVEMIYDLVREFNPRAKERGLYLRLRANEEKIPAILADQQKLRQVLANLLDNAIKYTEKGGLEISLRANKNKQTIVVKDTGEGLTDEELGKLFQSFSRAGAGQRLWIEGAGLGLYVAKKFIDMHRGKIWATSPGKGRGSTFHIELPIK